MKLNRSGRLRPVTKQQRKLYEDSGDKTPAHDKSKNETGRYRSYFLPVCFLFYDFLSGIRDLKKRCKAGVREDFLVFLIP